VASTLYITKKELKRDLLFRHTKEWALRRRNLRRDCTLDIKKEELNRGLHVKHKE
jgi:hypothetical protein